MLTPGIVLQNRYRIVSLLGQGGMGAVYRAWDMRLNISVAVKEMVPQPGIDPPTLAQLRQQFYQEAQVLARLDHPNLVRVTDYFEEWGNAYLVMNFVEGQSLADLIAARGPLPEARVLEWARQLLDALAYCHAQGVVHRDIKPQNIIIRADGRPILVDFGLAKLWDPRDPRTRTAVRAMGTPEYAPPEQYGTSLTDHRSDIYSLGATLYHALTGKEPPPAGERAANPKTPLPLPRLAPHLGNRTYHVVLKAMNLEKRDRWQSAEEMRKEVVRAMSDISPTSTGTSTIRQPAPTASSQSVPRSSDHRPAPASPQPHPGAPPAPRPASAPPQPGPGAPPGRYSTSAPHQSQPATPPASPAQRPAPGPQQPGPAPAFPSVRQPVASPPQQASAYDLSVGQTTPATAPQPFAGIPTWLLVFSVLLPLLLIVFLIVTVLQYASTQPSLSRSGHESSAGPNATPSRSIQDFGLLPGDVILPENATGVIQIAIFGLDYPVFCVTFSRDNALLASGGENTIHLWQVAQGKPLRTIKLNNSYVRCMALSPNGDILVSGLDNSSVQLWRVADGALLRTLEGHNAGVLSVAFSPDGQTLASGSVDRNVRLWRVSDGASLRTLEGHTGWVLSVAFSPDGQTLASGSYDRTVRLWRVSDGASLRTLEGHTDSVWSVAFSPDGQTLASGSGDATVRLWRVSDGALLRTLEGHTDSVRSVAFSPDGQTLASGAADHTVRLWRVADGALLHTLEGHTDMVRSVAFSPDGRLLASGSDDGTVRLWGVR